MGKVAVAAAPWVKLSMGQIHQVEGESKVDAIRGCFCGRNLAFTTGLRARSIRCLAIHASTVILLHSLVRNDSGRRFIGRQAAPSFFPGIFGMRELLQLMG